MNKMSPYDRRLVLALAALAEMDNLPRAARAFDHLAKCRRRDQVIDTLESLRLGVQAGANVTYQALVGVMRSIADARHQAAVAEGRVRANASGTYPVIGNEVQ